MARMPSSLVAWSGVFWLIIAVAALASDDGPELGGPGPQPSPKVTLPPSSPERPKPPIIETPPDDPSVPDDSSPLPKPAVLAPRSEQRAAPSRAPVSESPPLRPLQQRSSPADPLAALARQGQVMVRYDLTPYTQGLSSAQAGFEAVVDWIVRKTGRQTWHGSIPAMLYGDGRTLHVYHTSEVQARVAEVVERFVSQADKRIQFTAYVIQAPDPSWRRTFFVDLEPLAKPQPNGQAWVLERRRATQLIKLLHESLLGKPRLVVPNGQKATVALNAERTYQDLTRRMEVGKNARPELKWERTTAPLTSGTEIDLTGLWTADGQAVEATIEIRARQLANVRDVRVEAAGSGRATVEVPELVTAELRAEVTWPLEQVLLISTGLRPAAKEHRGIRPLGGERSDELLVLLEADPTDISPAPRPVAVKPAPRKSFRRFGRVRE